MNADERRRILESVRAMMRMDGYPVERLSDADVLAWSGYFVAGEDLVVGQKVTIGADGVARPHEPPKGETLIVRSNIPRGGIVWR